MSEPLGRSLRHGPLHHNDTCRPIHGNLLFHAIVNVGHVDLQDSSKSIIRPTSAQFQKGSYKLLHHLKVLRQFAVLSIAKDFSTHDSVRARKLSLCSARAKGEL
jgi:hypothetical protein